MHSLDNGDSIVSPTAADDIDGGYGGCDSFDGYNYCYRSNVCSNEWHWTLLLLLLLQWVVMMAAMRPLLLLLQDMFVSPSSAAFDMRHVAPYSDPEPDHCSDSFLCGVTYLCFSLCTWAVDSLNGRHSPRTQNFPLT